MASIADPGEEGDKIVAELHRDRRDRDTAAGLHRPASPAPAGWDPPGPHGVVADLEPRRQLRLGYVRRRPARRIASLTDRLGGSRSALRAPFPGWLRRAS